MGNFGKTTLPAIRSMGARRSTFSFVHCMLGTSGLKAPMPKHWQMHCSSLFGPIFYWHMSYELGENKFGLIPKVHALHEVAMEMFRQCDVSEWVLNPIAETCSIDEDMIGRVAVLSRSVSPKIIARRSLARYLAQINIVWARG